MYYSQAICTCKFTIRNYSIQQGRVEWTSVIKNFIDKTFFCYDLTSQCHGLVSVLDTFFKGSFFLSFF